MNDNIQATSRRVRARITPKTAIQDLNDPLTGAPDSRRIAAKITNLESAVEDLAGAVDQLDARSAG